MNKGLIAVVLTLCITVIACTKQTTPEAEIVKPILQRSEEYFANLRAYKKSGHQIFFGWFGSTGSAGDADFPGVMDRIPDSVDIVSMWGGIPPLDSYNYKMMQETRLRKGTRFVMVKFGSGIIGMDSSFSKLVAKDTMNAIAVMAKAISDTVNKYNIDGFDLDYEPGEAGEVNTIFGNGYKVNGRNRYVLRLFEELGKYLGPKSGTDKLLIIDGYSEYGISSYYSYFMQQAYYTTTPSALDSRLSSYGLGECPPEKFVPCEDFEAGWQTGGVAFKDPIRGTIPSLLGFAYWNPKQGGKGGCGAYHAEYDYAANPDYKYCRQAIQIMNPAAQ
ncbi:MULTISPECIES: glycoside hydrolase family 18 [Chitinophagaceae]